jgi:hypothetical protein
LAHNSRGLCVDNQTSDVWAHGSNTLPEMMYASYLRLLDAPALHNTTHAGSVTVQLLVTETECNKTTKLQRRPDVQSMTMAFFSKARTVSEGWAPTLSHFLMAGAFRFVSFRSGSYHPRFCSATACLTTHSDQGADEN